MKHISPRLIFLLAFCCALGATTFYNQAQAQDAQEAVANEGTDGAAEEDATAEGVEGAEATPPPPPVKLDKWNDGHSIPRSNSFAISWFKLPLMWLLFLLWVGSVDWVNRDSQINGLNHGLWNAVVFFPGFAALMVFVFPFFLPIPIVFVLGLGVFAVAYLGSFVPYVVVRNKKLEKHKRVFTSEWFRYEFALLANKVGIKMEAERKADYEKGVAVDLMALGAKDGQGDQANLISARQSPGYIFVKELIADMVAKRSDRVMLDYTQQSVVERHHVDGVWLGGEARERDSGDIMLAVMKKLANLDMAERRKTQKGKFGAKYEGSSYMCPIVSQGVKTGERVVVDLLGGKKKEDLLTLADLGMRDKLAEQWLEFFGAEKGLLVVSGMPEGGVTTLTDVSLMETDRLMRDFVSIEEKEKKEREIENIEVVTYEKSDDLEAIVTQVIRKYPNVLIFRKLKNPTIAKMLFGEVRDDRLLITTAKAKDAPEALLRILQQKVPHRDFAALVTAVLSTRLIRKLCDQCKVGYEPSPDLLKKLGIPASKVEALYRTPKAEEVDKPCPKCAGLGYYGRMGLFEMLVVSSKIREILVKQPKIELLRKAARAAHMRTFQEEGIVLVARGVTSIQELQRALK